MDVWWHVCMCKVGRIGGSGVCSPRKLLGIRGSEIASEASWDRESHSTYIACRVLHPIFGFPYIHLLSQLISNFRKKNGRCGDRWNSMHKRTAEQLQYAENTEKCEKSVKLILQQDVYRLPCIWLQALQLSLHCWWWLTWRTTGELVWAPEIVIYLHTYLARL